MDSEAPGAAGGAETGDSSTRARRWCRWCSEPVIVSGTSLPYPVRALAEMVHAASGEEKCADGEHAASPTDVDPEKRAACRRVRTDFPEYDVTWHLGLFRATLQGEPDPLIAPPVYAQAEDELRRRLGTDRSIRRHREHDAARAGESR